MNSLTTRLEHRERAYDIQMKAENNNVSRHISVANEWLQGTHYRREHNIRMAST